MDTPDLLREEYTIDTPENVTFGYDIAGIGSRILVVTAGIGDVEAVTLIRAGVAGIFHKHARPEELARFLDGARAVTPRPGGDRRPRPLPGAHRIFADFCGAGIDRAQDPKK